MKIIRPYFKLYTPSGLLTESRGVELLRFVESMARISHRSEDSQTSDSWKRFIQAVVLDHADWSVTEHASVTIIIRTDRAIANELVRHRIAAYTQESTRFVNYGDKPGQPEFDIEFIEPSWPESAGGKDGHNPLRYPWMQAMTFAEEQYKHLLSLGATPQFARGVLPLNTATTIAATYNLRTWRHLFLMRTSKETHPDFRVILEPCLSVFRSHIPLLYDDIETGNRQIDNLRKPR